MKPVAFDFIEERIAQSELRLTVVDQWRNNLLATEMLPHLRTRQLEGLDSLEAAIRRTLASAWAIRDRSELLHATRPRKAALQGIK